MEFYQALVLGLVQGLTEFLPVSSSGHLVLFQNIFGLKEPEIFFDICLHAGTLTAVIFYFRKDLSVLIKAFFIQSGNLIASKKTPAAILEDDDIRQILFILTGLVPTAIVGLMIEKFSDILFTSVLITGCMLILTGLIIWSTKGFFCDEAAENDNSFKKALIIGIVQGFAVIPGISRSGSTIAAGLFMGLDKEAAARFSFLMSIPAIAGAAVLSLKDVGKLDAASLQIIGSGMLIAAVSGYLALRFLVFIVKKGQMYAFAPYCWIAGGLAIACGALF